MTLASPNLRAPRFLPLRLPKVCLAVTGDEPEDMLETAESIVLENPFLEFRLDYLKQPAAALLKLRRFRDTHQYTTAIATCRREANGGKYKGFFFQAEDGIRDLRISIEDAQ